jgi:DNA repair ATPase RecN
MAQIMAGDGPELDRQVISITHLPQIAAHGQTYHYKVSKGGDPTGGYGEPHERSSPRSERVKRDSADAEWQRHLGGRY